MVTVHWPRVWQKITGAVDWSSSTLNKLYIAQALHCSGSTCQLTKVPSASAMCRSLQ
jgi:hypothetical protein